jgi:mono/diheme cytochrome c family protein
MALPRWTALLLLGTPLGAAEPAAADLAFFREKIEPVLQQNCYECHSAEAKKLKADLRLDSRQGMLHGGVSGPALVPGDPKASLIIQAIRHEGEYEMPSDKPKLSDSVIADFEQWVRTGAADPRTQITVPVAYDFAKAKSYWAFRALATSAPPAVPGLKPRSPIDAFVGAKLREKGLKPAPEATPAELIRRLSYDLTGLPPTPEEIEAFTKDRSPNAYERLVDRLLASPRYGERWAQHWLDVVRFAETEGFEYDRHLPDAWRYRDYVITALNADKPYDQFITDQLAGDELAAGDREKQSAAVFHRLGAVRRNAGNPEIALSRNEVLTERTDIIGSAFLGLTIGCARCHDHKFDPIPQADYYRLQAYLAGTEENNIELASEEEKKAFEEKTRPINAELRSMRKSLQGKEGAEKTKLEELIEQTEDKLPPPLAMIPSIMNDAAKRTPIHVLRRGVWENKGKQVAPRPLSVLVDETQPELPADTAHPRTELAKWLTSPTNPLTPRVIANRVWQYHFGLGIVPTANDFGVNGTAPSHPELLDWLAGELVRNGWRLKPLHRQIVLSSTYRQSSRSPLAEAARKIDPENRLLWQFSRRRLSAEELRDTMLAVAGRLNVDKIGGRSVIVPVEKQLVGLLYKPSQWTVTPDVTEHSRRSVYLIAKRNLRVPFLEAFDAPALQNSCPIRESSTHAPQALELLNGEFSNTLAKSFAERLEREARGDVLPMIERAYWLATGRAPTRTERQLSTTFLRSQPPAEFALAMFNLNAFLYVE